MKWLLPLMFLLAITASAQTTYTTTSDGCGAKNLGYCTLPVNGGTLTLDARVAPSGPINKLTLPTGIQYHGTFSGFNPNPNGTRNPYYDVGSFVSDDHSVVGTFQFYAWYVGTCSGKGCGPVAIGWHFRVLQESTVEAP